jgi:copper chaperone CopZ
VKAKTSTSSAISMTTVQVAAEDVTSTSGDFFVLNSAASTVVITEGDHILGDVNGDGQINLVDAVMVIRYCNNAKVFSSVEEKAADVNKDDKVTSLDALRIMQYYNGEVKSF